MKIALSPKECRANLINLFFYLDLIVSTFLCCPPLSTDGSFDQLAQNLLFNNNRPSLFWLRDARHAAEEVLKDAAVLSGSPPT